MTQTHGICENCDDPVSCGPGGWYRCRACGHESLRVDIGTQVARAIFEHRVQFDIADDATDVEVRSAARVALHQGDLFADELRKVRP